MEYSEAAIRLAVFQSLLLLSWHPFKAESYSSCGGVITDTGSGKVTSPFYPQRYPKNSNCEWTIIATFGQGIMLDIEHLDNKELSTSGGRGTCYDKLDIFQMRDSGLKVRIADSFCASSIAELDTTSYGVRAQPSGNTTIVIKFTSDYVTQLTGFSIAFEILCETTLSGSSGIIVSPGFPSPYPANTKCTTHIRVPPGRSVVLTFEDFQLESYPGCSNDYVSITDGVYEVSLGSSEKYCQALPGPFISTSNELDLVFHSDSNNNYRGFHASWTTEVATTTASATTVSNEFMTKTEYTGMCSTTVSGKTCQNWADNYPHVPKYFPNNRYHNFCRSPDLDKTEWCYTTDLKTRWEYCDVKSCMPTTYQSFSTSLSEKNEMSTSEIITVTANPKPTKPLLLVSTYQGTCSKTRSGKSCQNWTKTSPHRPMYTPQSANHNFCRSPNYDKTEWCYTTDPKTRWEYCDIQSCDAPTTTTAEAETSLSAESRAINIVNLLSVEDEEQSRSKLGYIIAGVGVGIIIMICMAVFIARSRRKKPNSLPHESVLFQNLTTEDVDGFDEYGRPRENTYVEIPCLPYEVPNCSNSCIGISTAQNGKHISSASIDSVAAAKLEMALQSKAEDEEERRRLSSSPPEPQGAINSLNKPYEMAEDTREDESAYQEPRKLTAQNSTSYNHVYCAAVEADPVASKPVQESSYAIPTTPPINSPVTISTLYDWPKSQPINSTNHAITQPEEEISKPRDNDYCTMDTVSSKKLNSNNSSNSPGDDVFNLYVAMEPQEKPQPKPRTKK